MLEQQKPKVVRPPHTFERITKVDKSHEFVPLLALEQLRCRRSVVITRAPSTCGDEINEK